KGRSLPRSFRRSEARWAEAPEWVGPVQMVRHRQATVPERDLPDAAVLHAVATHLALQLGLGELDELRLLLLGGGVSRSLLLHLVREVDFRDLPGAVPGSISHVDVRQTDDGELLIGEAEHGGREAGHASRELHAAQPPVAFLRIDIQNITIAEQ